MNCRETQASFDERLDRRLNPAETVAFDEHLNACAACAAHWRAYVDVWTALECQTIPNPSVGFAERTLRRLDEPANPEPVWRIWPVWRWAMVTGLALALAAGWLGLQHNRRANLAAVSEPQAEVYAAVTQDRLEDFDVIASLHLLSGGGHQ